MHRFRTSLVALVCVTAACQKPLPDHSAAAADEVRAADVAWEKAVSSMNLEASVAAVDSGGSMLSPNAPIATGHAALREEFKGMFATPGLTLHWKVTKVEASRSGELAYTTGTYEMTVTDPKGKVSTDHGKYATVWRKSDKANSWKVVLDAFNSDAPPPAAK